MYKEVGWDLGSWSTCPANGSKRSCFSYPGTVEVDGLKGRGDTLNPAMQWGLTESSSYIDTCAHLSAHSVQEAQD